MSRTPPGTVTAVAHEVVPLSIDTGLPFDDFRTSYTACREEEKRRIAELGPNGHCGDGPDSVVLQ